MKIIRTLPFLSILVFSSLVKADWTVQDSSQVNYLSTKVLANSVGSVTENNTFSKVTGTLTKAGKATINIDLTSLDTGIGIRNERVQNFVFGVASFSPNATIEANIPSEIMNTEAALFELPAKLTLAGQTHDVTLHIAMLKQGDDISVLSYRPTVVKGGEFKLAAGFAKLTELAGLGFIPMDIPVSFNVQLSAAK